MLFVLLGAILVLFMHAGFAFLEVGGALASPVAGRADPGFLHNGPLAQLVGTVGGIAVATASGFAVYGLIRATIGIRLGEEEFDGTDLAIHKISATSR